MPDVAITLTEDHALVLFEFLGRFAATGLLGTEDQAEQRALRDMHSLLKDQLGSLLDHKSLIDARDSLRDDRGTDAASEQISGQLAFWLHPDSLAFLADEWRKLPPDLPAEDRKRWGEIAFRAMSALHKSGITYTAKPSRHGYQLREPPSDTADS
ncbi:MAG: hypothetical protein AAGI63_10465 [Planctomycetota bacterium]